MIRTSLAILLVAASAGLGDRVPDDPAARGARSALRPAYGPFHQFRHPLATFAEAPVAINLPTAGDAFTRIDDRPSFRRNFFEPKDFNNHVGSLLEPEGRVLPFGSFLQRNYLTLPRFAVLNSFDGSPCLSPNGESGVCTVPRLCSAYGGRASGSCGTPASVCCINTVNRCGSVVTLNNTYWQSSAPIAPDSTCSLTVRLNPTLVEQRKNPVCQVRLDFEGFTIAQPNSQTVCSTDSFRVGGAVNKVPTICGQNGGQHMYLMVPSSTSDLQLVFSIGALTTIERGWRIRIGLLPCSADYLAPVDCLQYFTQSTGTVRSFNWRETPPSFAAPRQLANQDYNICFRTEQITASNTFSKVASSMCFAPCVITTPAAPGPGPLAFSLTGDSTASFPPGYAGAGTSNTQCPNTDYIVIESAVDANNPLNFNDRFCGNQLTASTGSNFPATLCTSVKPFKLLYRTDGSETGGEAANNGFCLLFEQRT